MDGTNAARRGSWDPRFPETEARRSEELLARLCSWADGLAGRVSVEVFFDGPRRPVGPARPPVFLRFSCERSADELILGSLRALRAGGQGAVVATDDGGLRGEALEEGARVIGFSELERRLACGRA